MTTELLFRYISDQANDQEIQEVQNWANESEIHKKELSQLKTSWVLASLSNDINPILKEQEIQRILDRIASLKKKKKQEEKTSAIWLKYAAIIFLSISISGSLGYFISKNQINEELGYSEIIVPKGERSKLILPDGSLVHLNSDSKLKFEPSFQSGKREVILEGEAYFQIAHDKNRPFIVDAGKLQIEVLGTTFNVCNYADDPKITTYLESGKVKVNLKNKKQLLLKPSQAIEYNKSTEKVLKFNSSDNYYTDWTVGTLTIKGKTIKELSKTLERRYDIDIIFGDDNVKNFMYTGSIKDEDLTVVLEALKFASALEYKINERNVILYSK